MRSGKLNDSGCQCNFYDRFYNFHERNFYFLDRNFYFPDHNFHLDDANYILAEGYYNLADDYCNLIGCKFIFQVSKCNHWPCKSNYPVTKIDGRCTKSLLAGRYSILPAGKFDKSADNCQKWRGDDKNRLPKSGRNLSGSAVCDRESGARRCFFKKNHISSNNWHNMKKGLSVKEGDGNG